MRSTLRFAVLASLALSALLQARGVMALVSAELVPPGPPSSGSSPLAAHAPAERPSAAPLLARNPFDHTAGSLAAEQPTAGDDVLPCPAVRALFTVRGEEEEGSLAALEVSGARLVRANGGELPGGMRVVRVGFDRVWLGQADAERATCVAEVFRRPPAEASAPPPRPATGADPRIAKGVVRVSDTETHVDRSALAALEETLSSGKLRATPERDARGRLAGLRLGTVAPGSVPALLGLATGDRLEAIAGIELDDTSALLEGWARLRGIGEGRVPIRVVRGGRTVQLDVVVK